MVYFLEKDEYLPEAVDERYGAQARYLSSVRGKIMLQLNGHNYTLNRKKNTTYYWECVKRRSKGLKCNSRVVSVDGIIKTIKGVHNHS